MSFYTCFDWSKKLRLFINVQNRKIDVVLEASRAVVIRWFSLNEGPFRLSKFISDYLPYFDKKINIFFNIITKTFELIYNDWSIDAAVYQWCGFKSRRGKNKNFTALRSNSNTVWFNFQTYIYMNPHHWYTAAPFAQPYVQRPTSTP